MCGHEVDVSGNCMSNSEKTPWLEVWVNCVHIVIIFVVTITRTDTLRFSPSMAGPIIALLCCYRSNF